MFPESLRISASTFRRKVLTTIVQKNVPVSRDSTYLVFHILAPGFDNSNAQERHKQLQPISTMAQNPAAILDAQDPASPLSVSAAQTALLLMDYHNFLTSRCAEQAAVAVQKANHMRNWALANGVLVVHCLVDMKQTILPSFKSAKRYSLMAAMVDTQPGSADEHPEIGFRAGSGEEIVTRRPGFISALKSQNLESMLSSKGIKSLILCGISTSGCVLSTARSAGDAEYIVTVIEDACLDPVPGLHDILVEKVLPSQAHVATAMAFQEKWGKGNSD